METPKRSLILIAVLFLPGTGQAEPLPDADYATLARAVIDQVVIPAYAEHAQATERLAPAIDRQSTILARSDGSHWDNHLLALRA